MKSLTIARIATIRQRAYSEFSNYSITPLIHGIVQLLKKGEGYTVYTVNLTKKTCNCPAFEKEGYCKHIAIVQMWNKRNTFHKASQPTTMFEAWLVRFTTCTTLRERAEQAEALYQEATFCPPIDAITVPGGDRY